MPDNTNDLFDRESKILEQAIAIAGQNNSSQEELLNGLTTLTKHYEKLMKQSRRIIRFSDKLQDNLNVANTELEEKNSLLKKRERVVKKDLKMAQNIQSSFLAKRNLTFPGIEIMHHYKPLDQVGGDFFDIIPINDEMLGIFVSDVSGHGIAAALITAMLKTATMVSKSLSASPKAFLDHINNQLYDIISGKYTSAFYAVIDLRKKKITYSTAGHIPQILHRKKSNEIIELANYGYLIGFFENLHNEESTIDLESGDRLLFYTDGVTEVSDKNRVFFGEERLYEYVKESASKEIKDFFHDLCDTLKTFAGDNLYKDDFTLISIDIL
jgi:serine phosphatase RsbU (regulator of sigma subunit)